MFLLIHRRPPANRIYISTRFYRGLFPNLKSGKGTLNNQGRLVKGYKLISIQTVQLPVDVSRSYGGESVGQNSFFIDKHRTCHFTGQKRIRCTIAGRGYERIVF